MIKNNRDSFKIINSDSKTQARTGKLHTIHGTVDTPVFLPVASQGSIKTLTPAELHDIEISFILSNTYHLYLQPGIGLIERMGGLHKFIKWDKSILTDSGGYQVFSLAPLCKLTNDGVTFRSHIDGSEHFLRPEDIIEFQEKLGVDIMMVLDECISMNANKTKVKAAMERTHSWALRCKNKRKKNDQLLFAIVQGGLYEDLRKESASVLTDMNFSGYAIGGLSLGEAKELTWTITDLTVGMLPKDKPRYLMGVGSPEDIIEGIGYGIDIFDSALPTRVARNGALFTRLGRRNIYKSSFKSQEDKIDRDCDCYTCNNFSVAYLHHLFKAGELLAYRLATIHNLRFIVRLISDVKNAISQNSYLDFKNQFLSQYKTTDEESRIAQKKKWITSRG